MMATLYGLAAAIGTRYELQFLSYLISQRFDVVTPLILVVWSTTQRLQLLPGQKGLRTKRLQRLLLVLAVDWPLVATGLDRGVALLF